VKTIALALLAAYKRFISPGLPVACRFTPTCSDYAAEAVARHGVLAGGALALWRLLRCNPLGGHGLDLVPEHLGFNTRSACPLCVGAHSKDETHSLADSSAQIGILP
jgi:putative membrane protein insertion efficiency factor